MCLEDPDPPGNSPGPAGERRPDEDSPLPGSTWTSAKTARRAPAKEVWSVVSQNAGGLSDVHKLLRHLDGAHGPSCRFFHALRDAKMVADLRFLVRREVFV